MPTPEPDDFVCTGFKPLDEMLGGGIPRGNVVLLRGGPGSGKTTLAMHLMAHHLTRRRAPTDIQPKAVYVSLELDPKEAMDHAASFAPCAGLQDLETSDDLRCISYNDLNNDWTTHIAPNATGGKPTSEEVLVNLLTKHLLLNWEGKYDRLMVVDSLSILVDLLALHTTEDGKELDLRSAMRIVSKLAKRWKDSQVTTVFIGEHHPSMGEMPDNAA